MSLRHCCIWSRLPPSPGLYYRGPSITGMLIAPSDNEIPVDDQPLPIDSSPTSLSSGYVADSDPSKEDPKEDLANYTTDGGDDDEEEESFEDDDDEEDKDEKEEHLAPAESAALPVIDPAPSAEKTEPFKTDESAATPPPPRSPQTRVSFSQTRLSMARKTFRPQALIIKYASTPTPLSPPPSPLSPLSCLLHRISSLPPHTSPTYTSAPLGYRVAMIQLRSASPLHVPSLPLPVPSPPFLLPFAYRRSNIPEMDMPFWKSLCLTALASRFEVEESSTVASASIRASESRVMTTVEEIDERVTDLATTQRQDAHELYVHDKNAQISLLMRESTDLEARTIALEAQTKALQRDKMQPKKTTTPMTDAAIKQLIAQRVADALAEHDANRNYRNRDDSHDSRSGRRRQVPTTRDTITAYGMTWKTLRKMMSDKYCLRSELKKLEIEIWNLKVKGINVVSYTQRFQELALMCGRMFPEESNEVEKQNVARAYTAGPGEKKDYGGSLPMCPKCNYHHNGQCAPRCNNCKKVGHLARDYRG
ncbi:hypothetical protein Tco_0847670 [Tanacetum coccineum]